MDRFFRAAALAAGLAGSAAGGAAAAPLGPGGWQTFDFEGPGSSWSRTFDFRVEGSALLKVTDCCLSGDRLEVYDGKRLLFVTSEPTVIGDLDTGDFDMNFEDPRWSSGSALLASGVYRIGEIALESPFGSGGGAVRVDAVQGSVTPVPLPAPAALLLGALAALGLVRLRRPG